MPLLSTAILALLLAVPASAAPVDAGPVAVHDPWVAEAPPVAKVLAGYLALENLSDREQVLSRVESPSFRRVEIHRTEVREGIARMMPVEHLSIPPRGKTVFEPGGQHLMLIGPVRPLHTGDAVDLTLELKGGHAITVTARVRPAAAGVSHEHHHAPADR